MHHIDIMIIMKNYYCIQSTGVNSRDGEKYFMTKMIIGGKESCIFSAMIPSAGAVFNAFIYGTKEEAQDQIDIMNEKKNSVWKYNIVKISFEDV